MYNIRSNVNININGKRKSMRVGVFSFGGSLKGLTMDVSIVSMIMDHLGIEYGSYNIGFDRMKEVSRGKVGVYDGKYGNGKMVDFLLGYDIFIFFEVLLSGLFDEILGMGDKMIFYLRRCPVCGSRPCGTRQIPHEFFPNLSCHP